jgi:hypothetical protein
MSRQEFIDAFNNREKRPEGIGDRLRSMVGIR